jgi:hypothetical protein
MNLAEKRQTEEIGEDAFTILKHLKENGKAGRSNKLADVKASLEPLVSMDFDRYFFFLRKFHYIAMDREAQLKVTDTGERLLDDGGGDKFTIEVKGFFLEEDDGPPPDQATSPSVEPLREVAPPAIAPAITTKSTPARPVSTPFPGFTSAFRPESAVPIPSPGAGESVDAQGRYSRLEPIGQGPLAAVFRARVNSLNVEVCVKELKDLPAYFSFLQRTEIGKRLKKELCAQAQVRHPCVVQVLDQTTEGSRPHFVTDLLYGSLKDRLAQKAGKGLEPKQALRWFLQAAYGLRAAHQHGLTHHNLKPENLLFDTYGNVKVADFGLTRLMDVDGAMPQVFLGTSGVPYLAPELLQKRKDVEVGASADVYALGVLLYEMLTGSLPGRRSPMPSQVNPEVPEKLDALFDTMTQDKREARPPDMDAVLQEFYGAFAGGEYLGRDDLILGSAHPSVTGPETLHELTLG